MRCIALALLVASSFVLSGCTFIGMGIGAAMSKDASVESVSRGDDVRVTTDAGEVVAGTVTPSRGDAVTVERDEHCGTVWLPTPCRVTRVQREHIRSIVRHTSYIGTGAAVGAVIDLLCIAAAIAGLVAFESNPG